MVDFGDLLFYFGYTVLVICVFNYILEHRYSSDEFLFLRISKHLLKEQEYRNDYACENFSNELTRRLKDAGYRVDCISGKLIVGNIIYNHKWIEICIPFEATTGNFISPNDKHYIEEREGC